MSYSILFKDIPQEKLEQYNVELQDFGAVYTDIKYAILETCFGYNKDDLNDPLNLFAHKLISEFSLMNRLAEQEAAYEFYNTYMQNGQNQYELCGSNYNQFYNGSEEIDSIIDYCTESLIKYVALIGIPNYWDDCDKWNSMYGDILDTIEYAKNEFHTQAMLKIKHDLYTYSNENCDCHDYNGNTDGLF